VLCHSSQNNAGEASVKWECNILRQNWKKKLQKINEPAMCSAEVLPFTH
jgi:hypothetical protein